MLCILATLYTWQQWQKHDVQILYTRLQRHDSSSSSNSSTTTPIQLQRDYNAYIPTAYCFWSVVSSFSNLNQLSSSPGLVCHVPLKRDYWHWDWKLRPNDTVDAIGCNIWLTNCDIWLTNLRLETETEWHSKCYRPCLFCRSVFVIYIAKEPSIRAKDTCETSKETN